MTDINQAILEVNRARSDFNWKSDLKNEGTKRLDMWFAAHGGDYIITPGTFDTLKGYTDDAIRREKDFRASGEVYKGLLLKYSNLYTQESLQGQLDTIEKDKQISLSDQNAEIQNYQSIEKFYMEEGQVGINVGRGIVAVALTVMAWASYEYRKVSKAEKVAKKAGIFPC